MAEIAAISMVGTGPRRLGFFTRLLDRATARPLKQGTSRSPASPFSFPTSPIQRNGSRLPGRQLLALNGPASSSIKTKCLRSSRAKLEELRLERRLFAGITAWSPLDIFDAGSSAVYFVGDPEGIADNVEIYRDEAKLSALILSGWPLIDEAETVSQLLLPRLNEIQ
jgi:hypothetical protein